MNGSNRSNRAASPHSSKHEVLRRVTRELAARRSSPIDLADAQREIVARVFFESAVGEAGDDAEGRRSLEQLGSMLLDSYRKPTVRKALLDEASRLRSADHNPELVRRLTRVLVSADGPSSAASTPVDETLSASPRYGGVNVVGPGSDRSTEDGLRQSDALASNRHAMEQLRSLPALDGAIEELIANREQEAAERAAQDSR